MFHAFTCFFYTFFPHLAHISTCPLVSYVMSGQTKRGFSFFVTFNSLVDECVCSRVGVCMHAQAYLGHVPMGLCGDQQAPRTLLSPLHWVTGLLVVPRLCFLKRCFETVSLCSPYWPQTCRILLPQLLDARIQLLPRRTHLVYSACSRLNICCLRYGTAFGRKMKFEFTLRKYSVKHMGLSY